MAKKATLRNSREDTANHNDRTYNSAESVTHPERTQENEYIVVLSNNSIKPVPGGQGEFEKSELAFYEQYYSEDLERKNAHYRNKGNHKAIKDMHEFLHAKNSKPMGEILQIGSMKDGAPSREVIEACVTDYIKYCMTRYPNLHILNFAYHADEETPHVHIRFIMDCMNEHGMLSPNQTKALKEMGFERPDPSKPEGRYNNPLMTFTEEIRAKWYEIIQEHGIEIDTTVDPKKKQHKETRQYKNEQKIKAQEEIIEKNEQEIKAQTETLNKNEQEIKENKVEIADINKQKNEAEKALTQKHQEIEEADKQLKDLRSDIDELNHDKTEKESELETLEEKTIIFNKTLTKYKVKKEEEIDKRSNAVAEKVLAKKNFLFVFAEMLIKKIAKFFGLHISEELGQQFIDTTWNEMLAQPKATTKNAFDDIKIAENIDEMQAELDDDFIK